MSPRFWCTKRRPAPRAATADPMSNGHAGDLGDGARIGLVVAGEGLDERRLAAAVGADEGVDLAGSMVSETSLSARWEANVLETWAADSAVGVAVAVVIALSAR